MHRSNHIECDDHCEREKERECYGFRDRSIDVCVVLQAGRTYQSVLVDVVGEVGIDEELILVREW